jgi:hypothetical protein
MRLPSYEPIYNFGRSFMDETGKEVGFRVGKVLIEPYMEHWSAPKVLIIRREYYRTLYFANWGKLPRVPVETSVDDELGKLRDEADIVVLEDYGADGSLSKVVVSVWKEKRKVVGE